MAHFSTGVRPAAAGEALGEHPRPRARPSLHGRCVSDAAAGTGAGAAAVVFDDSQPVPEARPLTQPTSAFHDLQASKAASIRALGQHVVAQDTGPGPRYFDLEANKARSARAR
jgi:hypothetical protein